jgi:hypothetical protein
MIQWLSPRRLAPSDQMTLRKTVVSGSKRARVATIKEAHKELRHAHRGFLRTVGSDMRVV